MTADRHERRTVVIAACVRCGVVREIEAGEILVGQHPMCDRCYMPMVAKEAKTQ